MFRRFFNEIPDLSVMRRDNPVDLSMSGRCYISGRSSDKTVFGNSDKGDIMFNETKHTCPIDWQDLYKRIPDEEIIAEFADSFAKNAQKLMTSLQEAVAGGDPEQIELYAHAVKGSASNIGAISLAKIAWQLEKTASEKQVETAADWLGKIEIEFKAVDLLLQEPGWIQHAKEAAHD